MKTKEQILTLLKEYSLMNVKDIMAVQGFLYQKNIQVKIPDVHASLPKINFEEFTEWFHIDVKKNDVIVLEDGTIGIVKDISLHSFILGACIVPNGEFITYRKDFPFCKIRNATQKEICDLQKRFNDHDLSWRSYKHEVGKRFMPKANVWVRVSVLGKVIALGVFKEIDLKGNVIMYCVKETDGVLRYQNLNEILCKASCCQFELATQFERNRFKNELLKYGVSWDAHTKTPKLLSNKVKNETYFYVSDALEVKKKVYFGDLADRKRRFIGNFFLNDKEAKKVIDIFKRLVEKSRNKNIEKNKTGKKQEMQFTI